MLKRDVMSNRRADFVQKESLSHAPLAPNDPNSITHQLTVSVSHLTSPNPLHGWHLAHICSFPLKPLYLSGDLRVTVV